MDTSEAREVQTQQTGSKKTLSIGLRSVEIHLSMFIYQTQHRKQVGTTKRVGHVNHLINHPMVVGPFSDQAN